MDQVGANLDDLHPRDGQAQAAGYPSTEHFIGQNADVLWVVLKLNDVILPIVAAHQVRLRATPHSADMLDRKQHVEAH
jgi:hypothetical protein